MDISIIKNQLSQMNLKYNTITDIRCKDGVSVYRIGINNKSYILKHLVNESDRREIENYGILNMLGIQTISLIAKTDCSLLLQDIEQSDEWRLGTSEDLNDKEVAVQIAKWYKQLHASGKNYLATYNGKMYDESDVITKENIEFIKAKTSTESNPVWEIINNNFALIKERILQTEKTMNYNDFYYTNLIVAKDKSSAFMFDYNLLGKGYAYSDIRNVCSSLGVEAKTAFLSEYGTFDKNEIIIDNVASTIATLYFACKREKFPYWGYSELEKVKNGCLHNAVKELIEVSI